MSDKVEQIIAAAAREDKGPITVTSRRHRIEEFDRISANMQFYYTQDGRRAVHHTCVYSHAVPKSPDEVYQRMYTIDTPSPLDLGWYAGSTVGHVLIVNKSQDAILHILVSGVVAFVVRPGHFMLLEPVDASLVSLAPAGEPVLIQAVVTAQ